MHSQKVVVVNKSGLHARPASLFVQTASKFKSNITVTKGEKTVSSKSLISILSLGISKDTEITLTANGEDEVEAINKIVELINSKFGEE
jgi:phosphotransferase system HPr (HPr) family protein